MAKRMLVDATHPEETRVVVLSGNRLEEFDYESVANAQLKGNVYLAKVTRVEPSLQAAFVDYGGNRHGFLAFSEIHPDYYRIPISDREALLEAQREEEAARAVTDDDLDDDAGADVPEEASNDEDVDNTAEESVADDTSNGGDDGGDDGNDDDAALADSEEDAVEKSAEEAEEKEGADAEEGAAEASNEEDAPEASEPVETLDGDAAEEMPRRRRPSFRRYRIQEVIARRQIMLVQVAKEERGNKGAAITSYISLAGRYCVLMPNTPRGGGISRKINHGTDRKKLKTILDSLDIPDGMAVIVRTAGAQRTKAEIRRDYEYLLKTWDDIRAKTLESTAPCLVHEEGNLIKRSIRDLYSKGIDEILIEGEDGYRSAKDFMKMLMPSHAKHVKLYKDEGIPLYQRYQIEAQIDNIHSPTVQLRSGGYIVLNPTEALVAIDVNSGRATRERNIEETAYRTNLEAADEVARQLRLRDLAGLIVIDFIDMEEGRNRHNVERRMKEAMRNDRARIQLGRISAFGLMEMSRQRLRPSVTEATMGVCPHCVGTGFVRSTESTALYVLRAIEEEGTRQRSDEITVHVPTGVALYILNQKRDMLAAIEARYSFKVLMFADDELNQADHRIERSVVRPGAIEEEPETAKNEEEKEGRGRRRRRGGRRRGRGDDNRAQDADGNQNEGDQTASSDASENAAGESDATQPAEAQSGDTQSGNGQSGDGQAKDEDGTKRKRRGRRGGRRRRRDGDDTQANANGEAQTAQANDSSSATTDEATSDTVGETVGDNGAATPPAVAEGNTPVASEEAAADEKPKRRRRSRSRATKPDDGETSSPTEAPPSSSLSENGADTSGSGAITDAVSENGEDKPKPRRRRRKPASRAAATPDASKAADDKPVNVEATGGDLPKEEVSPKAVTPPKSVSKESSASADGPPVDTPDTAVADDKPKSRRKGWWNLKT